MDNNSKMYNMNLRQVCARAEVSCEICSNSIKRMFQFLANLQRAIRQIMNDVASVTDGL